MSFPAGSYPMSDQAHPSYQPNFAPAPGNPGYYTWGQTTPHPPNPYPSLQGTQGAPWYGPPQAPNHPFPGRAPYYPTEPQMRPYASYGGGYAPQWNPNPEPQNHAYSRPSQSYPAYRHGVHTPQPSRGPADLPQHYLNPQNDPRSTSGPVHRRPSESRGDTQGHGAYMPYPGRPAEIPQPQLYPRGAPSRTSTPVHRRPSETREDTRTPPNFGAYPTPHYFPTNSYGAYTPHSGRPSDPPPQNAPSSNSGPVRPSRHPSEGPQVPNGHGAYTPYTGRPVDLPQQHFPPQEASWIPQTTGPARRYPSEPPEGTQYFPNPTVGPTFPKQTTPTYQLAETLRPSYPFVDWNITLPIASARLRVSRKQTTAIDFSKLAIFPAVRTVSIVASKAASPLGLALKRWGPISIEAEEPLTIDSLLNEIKKFFSTPIYTSDKKTMDRYLEEGIRASNSKRWKTQENDRMVWGTSVQIEVCRADTLFDNFQYGGLILDKDFGRNRKIELTLDAKYPATAN